MWTQLSHIGSSNQILSSNGTRISSALSISRSTPPQKLGKLLTLVSNKPVGSPERPGTSTYNVACSTTLGVLDLGPLDLGPLPWGC